MISPSQIKPLPGWVLCRRMRPSTQSKLVIPNLEDRPVSEGVGEVVAVMPTTRTRTAKGESVEYPQNEIKVGDKVLYRGFLEFANQVGELCGESPKELFLLHLGDILAVLDGEGVVGYHGEYRIG